MSKMIQIRDVPDRVHRILTKRAGMAGMSLSDFLKRELDLSTEKWTWEELEAYLGSMPPIDLGDTPTRLIRDMRDAGDRS
jgi:antitoxin FitA